MAEKTSEERRAEISTVRGQRIAKMGKRLDPSARADLVAAQGDLERKRGSEASMPAVEKLNENEDRQEAAGLSFKHGGTAPKTGTYQLHKGERIITMNKSRAAVHLGGSKSKSSSKKRHVHEMHIRHAANGGHIITHHFKPEEDENGAMQTPEPEEHVMPASEGNQMLGQHAAENMAPPPGAAPAGPAVGGQPVAPVSEGR